MKHEITVNRAPSGKSKVAILTIHFGVNHGSVLQAIALSSVVKSLGFEVEIIDYVPNRYKILENIKIKKRDSSFVTKTIYLMGSILIRFPQKLRFRRFIQKELPLTKKYTDSSMLYKNPPGADIYIVGSDQVWNYSYNDKEDTCYLLDFADHNACKISYAASFGKDYLEPEELTLFQKELSRFNAISTREKSGVDIVKTLGYEAEHSLDPVFLLPREKWLNFSDSKERTEKYVLVYVIAQDYDQLIKVARKVADELDCRLYAVAVRPLFRKEIDREFIFATPDEFLNLFINASYVLSNSFHGTAFSLILNKQFLTFSAKFNSRIESILNLTGLESRLISSIQQFTGVPSNVDYEVVNPIIQSEVDKSILYLTNNLK